MQSPVITRNTASDIPRKMIGAAGKRDRGLEPDEIGNLLGVLDRATFLYPAHPIAVRLLLLTLCRKGELVAAKSEHADLQKGKWYVPPSNQKSGIPHLVPLSPQAVALFKELRRLAGKAPYVLPRLEGRRDKPMAESSLNWALCLPK